MLLLLAVLCVTADHMRNNPKPLTLNSSPTTISPEHSFMFIVPDFVEFAAISVHRWSAVVIFLARCHRHKSLAIRARERLLNSFKALCPKVSTSSLRKTLP